MKLLLFLAVVFSTLPVFAVYEIGDSIPNICWKDETEKSFCLEEAKNTVKVLNYNTGWCPDCNEEMPKLVGLSKKYDSKKVTFLSLSAAAFESTGAPNAEFLKAWKDKFSIPFRVLGSPRDAGKSFFMPPISIPNFVLIDQDGKLAFKSLEATVETLGEEIDKLL